MAAAHAAPVYITLRPVLSHIQNTSRTIGNTQAAFHTFTPVYFNQIQNWHFPEPPNGIRKNIFFFKIEKEIVLYYITIFSKKIFKKV
jgi:hypothetical protein